MHLGVLTVLLAGFAPDFAPAQTSPADPSVTATPTPAIVEPALPTDPTAPATVQAPANPANSQRPAAPINPLIPDPLLIGVDPSQRPNAQIAPALPPPTVPADPSAIPAALPVAPETAGAAANSNPGTARRFQYAFALTLGVTYDDNIFLEPSGQRSDVYFTIQPTVTLGLGAGVGGSETDNSVRLSYSPQVLLYTDHTELDTVQHFINFAGTYHFPRLTLRGVQDIQILDSTDVGNPHPSTQVASGTSAGDGANPGGAPVVNNPTSSVNLDVGQRTRVNVFNSSLSGNYYISDKLSTDVTGALSISDYAGDLLSSRTLSASTFLNYTLTGKTIVGVGVSGGYVFADRPNPDQSFEQGNLRLSYVPSSKLVFAGQVGLELRQSTAQDRTAATPIFDLSVTYNPFDGTALTLAGNRQVQASAVLGGQDYRITGFTLSLSQRFLQKIFGRLSVGYSHSEYVATVDGVQPRRDDDYFFVQPGLDYNLRDNLSLGGFYSHRQSVSTLGNRNFTDDQVGARLSFTF